VAGDWPAGVRFLAEKRATSKGPEPRSGLGKWMASSARPGDAGRYWADRSRTQRDGKPMR
jgi:hypothetical protein